MCHALSYKTILEFSVSTQYGQVCSGLSAARHLQCHTSWEMMNSLDLYGDIITGY